MNTPEGQTPPEESTQPRRRRSPPHLPAIRHDRLPHPYLLPDKIQTELRAIKARGHAPGFWVGETMGGTIISVESKLLRDRLLQVFERINGNPVPIQDLDIGEFVELSVEEGAVIRNIDLEDNFLELHIVWRNAGNALIVKLSLATDDDEVLSQGLIKIFATNSGLVASTRITRVDETPALKELLGRFTMQLDRQMLAYLQTLATQTNEPVHHIPEESNPKKIPGWEKKFGPMLAELGYEHLQPGKWKKIYQPKR